MAECLTADTSRQIEELRRKVSSNSLDLLDGTDGRYSEWATACAIATDAMNKGIDENEFIALVEASDFAQTFATENGRDRSDRLRSRLSKVWSRVEDVWNPPLGDVADVRRRLADLADRLDRHRWTGRTASKDRAVAFALVEWAHEVGVWTLDASTRELSLRAGIATATASRALSRLSELGLVSRDQKPRESLAAQRWIIDLGWNAKGQTETYKPFPPREESCVLTMSLRSTGHPAFLGGGLGQTCERVWLDLTDNGESTVASVADRLGLNPKTVRRNLDKLEANRLVRSSEGRPVRYRVDPTVDADHLDRVADAYGVLDWEAKASERFTRERAGYAEALRQRYEQASV